MLLTSEPSLQPTVMLGFVGGQLSFRFAETLSQMNKAECDRAGHQSSSVSQLTNLDTTHKYSNTIHITHTHTHTHT